MTLRDYDAFVRATLITPMQEADAVDNAVNGLQVAPPDHDVATIAFAVDSGLEVVERAAESGADLLFVHHGLFWGEQRPLTGPVYRRVSALIQNELALYAVHLPLDAHPELGNNAGMAVALGLERKQPFGRYHGVNIGVAGELSTASYPEGATLDEILGTLFAGRDRCNAVLPFGTPRIRSVGLVSGGGTRIVGQAIDADLDLYITGDSSHEVYHDCLEAGINVVFGGHYATETWGVRTMMEQTARLGLQTTFVDVPTGL